MQKKLKLFFMTALICFASIALASQNPEIAKRNAELLSVTGKIDQLNKNISFEQTRQNHLQYELEISEKFINKLTQQITALGKQLSAEQAAIAKLKIAQANFNEKLSKQNTALAEQVRIIYQMGSAHSVKTLLNLDNLNTINRQLYYHHSLTDARLELVTEIKKTLAILNSNMMQITLHEANLKKLLKNKYQQQIKQQLAQKKRLSIISQINEQTKTQQQQVHALTTDQKNLQDILATLEKTVSKKYDPIFSQLRGKLKWPVKGAIIGAYGSNVGIKDRFLSGVIIKATNNTPVHSIYPGKVIFANWLRGFGLLIIINHGNGYMSLYGRNYALFAKVGDTVTPQDMIATIGNSGGYSSPSLYFEIRHNGTPIDPNLWCS
ncbi:MAG: peptidoglycan DD-metalloendopeptidase family protein [Gammaproteobacteria bacterium]|nr:peptidoglycan DD-metalloendopeptidase family protein [Gammaproteobacteria bacterium]